MNLKSISKNQTKIINEVPKEIVLLNSRKNNSKSTNIDNQINLSGNIITYKLDKILRNNDENNTISIRKLVIFTSRVVEEENDNIDLLRYVLKTLNKCYDIMIINEVEYVKSKIMLDDYQEWVVKVKQRKLIEIMKDTLE